jgi:hypothetical protein
VANPMPGQGLRWLAAGVSSPMDLAQHAVWDAPPPRRAVGRAGRRLRVLSQPVGERSVPLREFAPGSRGGGQRIGGVG